MHLAAADSTCTVALIGNPNTGKSTLFSALAGVRQQVGNYPGVTVEKKIGRMTHEGRRFTLIDLPGTYSLAPRSPDEMVAVDVLLGRRSDAPAPDAVLCIVDASNLERNLYLVSQVLELGLPTVVALNMIDVARDRGVQLNVERLRGQLGVTVIEVQANRRLGLDELKAALAAGSRRSGRSAGKPVSRRLPPGSGAPGRLACRTQRGACSSRIAALPGRTADSRFGRLPRRTPAVGRRCGHNGRVGRRSAPAGRGGLPGAGRRGHGSLWLGQPRAGRRRHAPAERPTTASDRIDQRADAPAVGLAVLPADDGVGVPGGVPPGRLADGVDRRRNRRRGPMGRKPDGRRRPAQSVGRRA